MDKNRGFISANALFIMMIILISALFLIYTYNQEYLIINSSKNNIQTYYLAESKIHLVLKKEEYYYQQLLPRIKYYLRYGRLGPSYDRRISLDVDDLYGEDNNNIVIIGFSEENKRRILELETYSTYSGITKNIFVKLTIINNLFEMWIPIVSSEHIQQDKIEEFTNYMLFLKEKIEIPDLPNGIVGIDAINHEDVKIRKGLDKKISIEFYRNNMEEPVKRETLIKDEIFTLIKSNHTHPTLSIVSDEESDKVILKGIIYIEGDLIIQSDLEFYGILILQNGGIIVDSTNEVKIQGILLLHNYNDNLMEYEKIESTYNLEAIKTYGIYLPKFIEPNIQVIKSY